MATNKIIASQLIKNINKAGKDIAVKYATKTEAWDRTFLAPQVQEQFTKVIEKANVPSNATTAVLA